MPEQLQRSLCALTVGGKNHDQTLKLFQAGHATKDAKESSIMENRRFIVGIVGVYLFSVGLLSGMLFERIQFDLSRTVILKELDEQRDRLHQRLMAMEREGFVDSK
jgi:hypothetical protein